MCQKSNDVTAGHLMAPGSWLHPPFVAKTISCWLYEQSEGEESQIIYRLAGGKADIINCCKYGNFICTTTFPCGIHRVSHPPLDLKNDFLFFLLNCQMFETFRYFSPFSRISNR